MIDWILDLWYQLIFWKRLRPMWARLHRIIGHSERKKMWLIEPQGNYDYRRCRCGDLFWWKRKEGWATAQPQGDAVWIITSQCKGADHSGQNRNLARV